MSSSRIGTSAFRAARSVMLLLIVLAPAVLVAIMLLVKVKALP